MMMMMVVIELNPSWLRHTAAATVETMTRNTLSSLSHIINYSIELYAPRSTRSNRSGLHLPLGDNKTNKTNKFLNIFSLL